MRQKERGYKTIYGRNLQAQQNKLQ